MLIFKVLVLGDAAAGKTCLMNNYLGKPFIDHETPTIGVEFGSQAEELTEIIRPELLKKYREAFENKQYPIQTGVKMHIWNSSGQERFRSIVKSYYRNAKGVIFVCDLTRKITFNHLEYWIEDFDKHATKSLSEMGAVIVGTKSDLGSQREIYDEDLRQLAEKHHLPFFTVSSKKDKEKIRRLFHNLANQMLEKYVQDPPPEDEFSLHKIQIEKRQRVDHNKWCCWL